MCVSSTAAPVDHSTAEVVSLNVLEMLPWKPLAVDCALYLRALTGGTCRIPDGTDAFANVELEGLESACFPNLDRFPFGFTLDPSSSHACYLLPVNIQ